MCYRSNIKSYKNSSGDEITNVNFYAVRPEATRIRWNNAITPFKVTDFCANRKLIYDFLLVINTNLPPILHRFRDIAVDRSEIERALQTDDTDGRAIAYSERDRE